MIGFVVKSYAAESMYFNMDTATQAETSECLWAERRSIMGDFVQPFGVNELLVITDEIDVQ